MKLQPVNSIWVVDFYGESSGYPALYFFSTYEKAKEFYEKQRAEPNNTYRNYWSIYQEIVDDPANGPIL